MSMNAASAFDRVDEAYGTLRGAELESALLRILADCGAEAGECSPLYAAVCSELGGYYRGQARYGESEGFFLKTLEILDTLGRKESPDYTTAMNNLAGTYRVMKKYDAAEALFRQVNERNAATLGKGHVLYAAGLNNYALLCLDMGRLDRAAELLGESAEVLSHLKECEDEYAAALCNRSALLLRLQRGGEAIGLLRTAIGLFETTLGTDTPHYHAALHSLGLAELLEQNLPAAADAFAAAEKAAEALYGAEHPETRRIRSALADTRRKLEEFT